MKYERDCFSCGSQVAEECTEQVEGPEPFAEGGDSDDAWVAESLFPDLAIFREYTCLNCGWVDMTVEIHVRKLIQLTGDSLPRAQFDFKRLPAEERSSDVSRWSKYERRPLGLVVSPSPQFARIVGSNDQPRSEAVAKFWAYVETQKLRDDDDPRNIRADRRLRGIFEKGTASMAEMSSIFDKHLDPIRDANGIGGWKVTNPPPQLPSVAKDDQ